MAPLAPAPVVAAVEMQSAPLLRPAALAPVAPMPPPPSTPTSSSGPPKTMVSKEWVIPPRPKPGRKPATDTPPTKRKAQNRAAQRAFRERRAARVGELEDQLDEQRRGHEQAERDAHDQVRRLELELQSCRTELAVMQTMFERERQERLRAETELRAMRMRETEGFLEMGQQQQQQPQPAGHRGHRQQPGGHHHQPPAHGNVQAHQPQLPSQPHSPPDNNNNHLSAPPSLHACGVCQPDGPCICEDAVNKVLEAWPRCDGCELPSRCACIEKAFDSAVRPVDDALPQPVDDAQSVGALPHSVGALSPTAPPAKRHLSPSPPPLPDKRARADASWETDFTSMWARGEPAEGAAETAAPHQMHTPPPCDSDPKPTSQVAHAHAPPAPAPPLYVEITSTGAVKLPPRKKGNAMCGPSGPGTCAQCVEDPNGSGRFCRMLAAKLVGQAGGGGGGCCGGRGPGGGCCRDTRPGASSGASVIPSPAPPLAPTNTPAAPPSALARPKRNARFSVAEAYRTLSSHQAFDRAFDDVGSWLPKLRPVPASASAPASAAPPAESRPGSSYGGTDDSGTRTPAAAEPDARVPMEVEAASVMSVLRHFDVRFGRDC